MAEVGVIGKDRENKGQSYKFRGIDDVVERVSPLLVKHGITCSPRVLSYKYEQVETKNSRQMHVICEVEHKYKAADGSFELVTTLGEAMDTGDKASNKAMSAALKYAHAEYFQIRTFGPDADTESQSPELTSKRDSQPQRPASPPQRSPGTPPPAPKPDNGALFPAYGSMKGLPIRGAKLKDLNWYAQNCRTAINDPAKARWKDKEQATLEALEAEIERQTNGRHAEQDAQSQREDEPPPPSDEDAPF